MVWGLLRYRTHGIYVSVKEVRENYQRELIFKDTPNSNYIKLGLCLFFELYVNIETFFKKGGYVFVDKIKRLLFGNEPF